MWIVIPNYINTCYICTIKSVIQITGHWKLHILEKRMLRFRCSFDRDYSIYILGGTHFSFFFLFFSLHAFQLGDRSYCSHCVVTVHALFSHFFTIHTFKNYFVTIFSVFSKNNMYPNEPLNIAGGILRSIYSENWK